MVQMNQNALGTVVALLEMLREAEYTPPTEAAQRNTQSVVHGKATDMTKRLFTLRGLLAKEGLDLRTQIQAEARKDDREVYDSLQRLYRNAYLRYGIVAELLHFELMSTFPEIKVHHRIEIDPDWSVVSSDPSADSLMTLVFGESPMATMFGNSPSGKPN